MSTATVTAMHCHQPGQRRDRCQLDLWLLAHDSSGIALGAPSPWQYCGMLPVLLLLLLLLTVAAPAPPVGIFYTLHWLRSVPVPEPELGRHRVLSHRRPLPTALQ